MRGIVIVLMALDHTRDFVGTSTIDPLDADVTNLPLYLCAGSPTFGADVLLPDGGRCIVCRARKNAGPALPVSPEPGAPPRVFRDHGHQVRASVELLARHDPGDCALVTGLVAGLPVVLVFLPSRSVGAIGVVMILAHNLLDGINSDSFGALRPLWLILHEKGVIALTAGCNFRIVYPLIPWIGVAAAGFGFGEIMPASPRRRQTVLISLGLFMTALFFLLQAFDFYGDPLKWSPKPTALRTCFSFFNCEKNPPSLLFLLMTLGPMFILLAWLEHRFLPAFVSRFLITFGRVPLFFFLTHLYLIRLVAVVAAGVRAFLPAFGRAPGVKRSAPTLTCRMSTSGSQS